MSISTIRSKVVGAIAVAAVTFSVPAFAQVDADAAKALFKENDCTKCHSPDKSKKGPSLKKISAKYKEKKQTEQEVMKHLTSAMKVKLDDGTEEEHKILDAKDAKGVANMAKWILSF